MGSNKRYVTIPYHTDTNLPDSRQEKRVVNLDEGESEANIIVPLNMVQNKFPDINSSDCDWSAKGCERCCRRRESLFGRRQDL